MPIPDKLKALMEQYKISEERYDDILKMIFSDDELDKIATSPYADRSFQLLTVPVMWNLMSGGFTPADIYQMTVNGGSDVLLMVMRSRRALMQFGFTVPQIVQIAAYPDGHKAIEAILNARPRLKFYKPNLQEIVNKIAFTDGYKNLEAVLIDQAQQTLSLEQHGATQNIERMLSLKAESAPEIKEFCLPGREVKRQKMCRDFKFSKSVNLLWSSLHDSLSKVPEFTPSREEARDHRKFLARAG